MRKRLILLLIIIFAAPLWALAAVPQVGEEALDFTLPTLEGKSFQLSLIFPPPRETQGTQSKSTPTKDTKTKEAETKSAPSKGAANPPGAGVKEGETKGVVMAFFATWCGPCRYELPELEKLHRTYNAKGIKVIALCLDEDLPPAELKKFVKRLNLTFPIVLDNQGKAARSYGVRPIPNSFVIGPGRKIEGRYIGYSAKNLQEITRLVQRLAK